MRSKRGSSTQTMCYVVAYDIPDDRRRTKVHQILMGFGKWTQYSLFECFLSRKDLILLQSKLDESLLDAQDSVRFYPYAPAVWRKSKRSGDPLHRMRCCSSSKLSREARRNNRSERDASRPCRSGFRRK